MWPVIIPYVALLAVGLAASVFDLRTGRVPNALTYSAILVALAYWAAVGALEGARVEGDGLSAAVGGWHGFRDSGVAALCGLVPMAVLVLMGGLGGGDMKLTGAIGAWAASWEAVLGTAVYALVIAAGMAVVVMVRRKIVRQTLSRVLGAAAMASSRVKPKLPDAHDPETATVPFAVALAVGAAVAGAEHLLGWQPPWAGW